MFPPLIRAIGLRKEHRMAQTTVHALQGVTLELDPGDFVAVVGPSGSGKSTLMNLLGLLDRPTAGSYFLAGQDVLELDPDRRAAVRIGASASSSRHSICSPGAPHWKTSSCRWYMPGSPGASAGGGAKPRSRRSAWPIGAITGRASCPAVSSNVSRSRARWSTIPS